MERGKVLILSDSNGRNLFSLLKHSLHGQYSVFAFIKPNAKLKDVVDSIDDLTSDFNRRDYVLIVGGTNDVTSDTKYQTTITEALDNLVPISLKTNLILTEIPQNYFHKMYKIIKEANRFMRNAIYIKYKTVVNNIDFMLLGKMFRRCDFTRHGLHMNLKGKTKLAIAFASVIRGVTITEVELQLINDCIRQDMSVPETSRMPPGRPESRKSRRGKKNHIKQKVEKENMFTKEDLVAKDNINKRKYRHRAENRDLKGRNEVTKENALRIPKKEHTKLNENREENKELRTDQSIIATVDTNYSRIHEGFSEENTQVKSVRIPEYVTCDMIDFVNNSLLIKVEQLMKQCERPADCDNIASESADSTKPIKSNTLSSYDEIRIGLPNEEIYISETNNIFSLNIPQVECTPLSEVINYDDDMKNGTTEALSTKFDETVKSNLGSKFVIEVAGSQIILTCKNVTIELCIDENDPILNTDEGFLLDLSQVEYLNVSENITTELLDFIKEIHLIKVEKLVDQTGSSVEGKYEACTNNKYENITKPTNSEDISTCGVKFEMYRNDNRLKNNQSIFQPDYLSHPSNITTELENFISEYLLIKVEELVNQTERIFGKETIELTYNSYVNNNNATVSTNSYNLETTSIYKDVKTKTYENNLLETDKEFRLNMSDAVSYNLNPETTDFKNENLLIEDKELTDQIHSPTELRNMKNRDNGGHSFMERTESKCFSTNGETELSKDEIDSRLDTDKFFNLDTSIVECITLSENKIPVPINHVIERLLIEVEKIVDQAEGAKSKDHNDKYTNNRSIVFIETESEVHSMSRDVKIELKNENVNALEIDTGLVLDFSYMTIDSVNIANESVLIKELVNRSEKLIDKRDNGNTRSSTEEIGCASVSTCNIEIDENNNLETNKRFSSGISQIESVSIHQKISSELTDFLNEKLLTEVVKLVDQVESPTDRELSGNERENNQVLGITEETENYPICENIKIDTSQNENLTHVASLTSSENVKHSDLVSNMLDTGEELADQIDCDNDYGYNSSVSSESTIFETVSSCDEFNIELNNDNNVSDHSFDVSTIKRYEISEHIIPDRHVNGDLIIEIEEHLVEPDKSVKHAGSVENERSGCNLVSVEKAELIDSTCEDIYTELDCNKHLCNNFEVPPVFNVGVPQSDGVVPGMEENADLLLKVEEQSDQLVKSVKDVCSDNKSSHSCVVSVETKKLETDSACEDIYMALDDNTLIEPRTIFTCRVPQSDHHMIPKNATPVLIDYVNESLFMEFDRLPPKTDPDSINGFHLIEDNNVEVDAELSDTAKENVKIDSVSMFISKAERISETVPKQIDLIDFENGIDLMKFDSGHGIDTSERGSVCDRCNTSSDFESENEDYIDSEGV